jgi:hypothetical protein
LLHERIVNQPRYELYLLLSQPDTSVDITGGSAGKGNVANQLDIAVQAFFGRKYTCLLQKLSEPVLYLAIYLGSLWVA